MTYRYTWTWFYPNGTVEKQAAVNSLTPSQMDNGLSAQSSGGEFGTYRNLKAFDASTGAPIDISSAVLIPLPPVLPAPQTPIPAELIERARAQGVPQALLDTSELFQQHLENPHKPLRLYVERSDGKVDTGLMPNYLLPNLRALTTVLNSSLTADFDPRQFASMNDMHYWAWTHNEQVAAVADPMEVLRIVRGTDPIPVGYTVKESDFPPAHPGVTTSGIPWWGWAVGGYIAYKVLF